MKKKLIKWWDKINNTWASFYVVYEDGGKTRLLTYQEAKSLAEVFKGKIYHKLDR